MARTLNPHAHAAKRNSILDAAESLIVSNGFAKLSIPDLVAAAGMSKGAFYHYYPAKADLLEALLDRRLDRWQSRIEPIARSGSSATNRMLEILRTIGFAKLADRDFLIDSLDSLYADENALVHRRTRVGAAIRLTPIIAEVVEAGARTGEFQTHDSISTTRVVMSLLQECADTIGMMLLDISHGQAGETGLRSISHAYVQAIHSALGAASGTISFIDERDLAAWGAAAASQVSRRSTESPR